MECVFARAGFTLLDRQSSRHKGLYRPGNAKHASRTTLYALSYPFMAGAKHGEVMLFAFQRQP
jgi:hypothetical protein